VRRVSCSTFWRKPGGELEWGKKDEPTNVGKKRVESQTLSKVCGGEGIVHIGGQVNLPALLGKLHP